MKDYDVDKQPEHSSMRTNGVDNCCEYSGIYLEGRCKHSCHSKAPEKDLINGWAKIQEGPKVLVEAPTDESWATQLREIVMQSIGKASMCWSETPKGEFAANKAISVGDRLIEHIASLLQKEREKAMAYPDQVEVWVQAGKSEAFSLVRKMIDEMPRHALALSIRNLSGGHDGIDTCLLYKMLRQLSTLEGGGTVEGCFRCSFPEAGHIPHDFSCHSKKEEKTACAHCLESKGHLEGCKYFNRETPKVPEKLQADIGWSPAEYSLRDKISEILDYLKAHE